jgi:uncharacterized protein DUF4160
VPTVLRQEGYDIVIRSNDHEPPHVHVFEGDGEAKIDLDPVEVKQVWNMKRQVARKARRIVIENQEYLLQQWEEIHGK